MKCKNDCCHLGPGQTLKLKKSMYKSQAGEVWFVWCRNRFVHTDAYYVSGEDPEAVFSSEIPRSTKQRSVSEAVGGRCRDNTKNLAITPLFLYN